MPEQSPPLVRTANLDGRGPFGIGVEVPETGGEVAGEEGRVDAGKPLLRSIAAKELDWMSKALEMVQGKLFGQFNR